MRNHLIITMLNINGRIKGAFREYAPPSPYWSSEYCGLLSSACPCHPTPLQIAKERAVSQSPSPAAKLHAFRPHALKCSSSGRSPGIYIFSQRSTFEAQDLMSSNVLNSVNQINSKKFLERIFVITRFCCIGKGKAFLY